MKLIFIIVGIVCVILGAIFFVLFQNLNAPSSSPSITTTLPPEGVNQTTTIIPSGAPNSTTGSGGTPSGISPTNPIPVVTQSGSTIQVSDFRKDPSVKTAPEIPGYYYLAGGLNGQNTGSPYSIWYVDSDQSFNIGLWQEPIGEVRRLAEQDLLRRLGISEADACNLVYSVLVPYRVNSIYAGKNLGFSFCPGSTKL